MSVIQKIQEKYAKLMAVIIAIALIIFVIMLAFENGGNIFGGSGTSTVGKVNGESIEFASFQRKVDQTEEMMRQQGYGDGEGLRQQAINNAWNQEVSRLLIVSEIEKLGIQVGKKEYGDLLYGPNAAPTIKQAFTDPQTGVFDAQRAKRQIDAILNSNTRETQEQKAMINAELYNIEMNRLYEKYFSLVGNSVYVPKWFVEKQNADNSQIAKISFTKELYFNIPDTTIKISDKEIADFVAKRKDQYKQLENRSIAYVAFSALPTRQDSTNTLDAVMALKPEFDTTSDAAAVIARNGSALPYSDSYYPKSHLQQANQTMGLGFKDTILTLPKGGVYGPYIDGDSYVLAKLIDTRTLPDSVKSRHILLGTVDPRTGQPQMPDTMAKRIVDSIYFAINSGGANFDTLETKYTTDEVSHQSKGVMTVSSRDLQDSYAPEYTKFILFDGKPGDRKVVKTSFGWHYIEVLEYIKPEPHYKVAYFSKKVEPSAETDNAAETEAAQFAAGSRNQKEFDANAEKLKAKGINKLIAQQITPDAFEIRGLGFSRTFIKNIYEADKGDVLSPERVGDSYVVAIVTEVNEEGTQSVAAARPSVEPLLINHKKAEIIIKKIGKVTTLEAASTALGQPVEVADSIRMSGVRPPNLASEAKVIGAAFNPANRGKVITEPIEGQSGVYVVRVDNVGTTPVAEANIEEQRKSMIQQAKMRGGDPLRSLREAAKIKDNRSKIY